MNTHSPPTPNALVLRTTHATAAAYRRSFDRYDGRVYNASSLVSGLVTLGTPHVRLEDEQGRPRELPFSRNFKVTTSERSWCGTPISNEAFLFLHAWYDSVVVRLKQHFSEISGRVLNP